VKSGAQNAAHGNQAFGLPLDNIFAFADQAQ
jgi:hypothetical protein